MYCLCCDRWGRDGLVAPADAKKVSETRRGRRSQPSPKEQARLEQLQYERERAHRKAKRLAHHQAQVEADQLRKKIKPAQNHARSKPRSTPGGPV